MTDTNERDELVAKAEALAAELGRQVAIGSMGKRRLLALVEELEQERAARSASSSASATAETTEATEAAAAAPAACEKTYTVAPGGAITSLRGILGPGASVTVRDINASPEEAAERLALLARNGHLVES